MNYLIVGAGIAGLSLALRLLRDGHQVTVAEKQKGPIDKVCGEGLLPFGTTLLDELGLLEAVKKAGGSFDGIRYRYRDRSVEGTFRNGARGIGIDRGTLDRMLRQACHEYDRFELLEGHKIQPQDPIDADRVFAADGVFSLWSAPTGREVCIGNRLGARFRLVAPPPDKVTVRFFPFGEVYLTPTGTGSLSVALLLRRNRIPVMGADLQPWCASWFAEAFPELAGSTWLDWQTRGSIVATYRGPMPKVHLLGDALHTFDPISGAGMSFSLMCAKLAARYAEDPAGYYRAMAPIRRSIADFTNLVLFFSGGGVRTNVMLRQLALAPHAFNRILAIFDGRHRPWHLGLKHAIPLLRPW